MIMLFVAILMVGVTTILAASVDLSKTAYLKQKQAEREAKWQYCVDSGKALATENFFQGSQTQTFSQTINNVALTIATSTDTWATYGCKADISGVLDGKSRSSRIYLGRRSTIQPCQFGVFCTEMIEPSSTVTVKGDIYFPEKTTAESIAVTGDAYSPLTSNLSFSSLSGAFYGKQPKFTYNLDATAYYNSASTRTSGTTTVNGLLSLLTLTKSVLRYHSGDLTLKGTITGEFTIFVNGNITLQNPRTLTSLISRLVIICNGNVYIKGGTTDAFIICSGNVTSDGSGGDRTVNGSIAASQFLATDSNWTVKFDSYFVDYTAGGERYWIPGQW